MCNVYAMTDKEKMKMMGEILKAGGLPKWIMETSSDRFNNKLWKTFYPEFERLRYAVNQSVDNPSLRSKENYLKKLELDTIMDINYKYGHVSEVMHNKWEKIRCKERIKEDDEEKRRQYEFEQKTKMKEATITEIAESLTPIVITFLASSDDK